LSDFGFVRGTEVSKGYHVIGAGEVEPEPIRCLARRTAAITGHTSAADGPCAKGTARAAIEPLLVRAAMRKTFENMPLCPLLHRAGANAA